ncbi:MAG: hypothetical protein H6712_23880 [Myxococcales bacterium]|nr:hypothetical protein [Myxococcales bacterium]MCB9716919.1 hypothetical protein [Myxococcales bacterium]
MNTPRSTEELTKTIEQLVEGYVAEGRRAAREAIEHAFGAATRPAARTTKAGATPRRPGHPSGRRRSVQELEQLEERLCQLVRARPGESLTTFAAELQMTVRALQRPMSGLRQQGRVRSVGQRNHTRYFPTVGRKTASAS